MEQLINFLYVLFIKRTFFLISSETIKTVSCKVYMHSRIRCLQQLDKKLYLTTDQNMKWIIYGGKNK